MNEEQENIWKRKVEEGSGIIRPDVVKAADAEFQRRRAGGAG